jgi:hypothetical protein
MPPRGDMPKYRILVHKGRSHVFLHLHFFRQIVSSDRYGERAEALRPLINIGYPPILFLCHIP